MAVHWRCRALSAGDELQSIPQADTDDEAPPMPTIRLPVIPPADPTRTIPLGANRIAVMVLD
jgi:hypothetical protein